MVKGGEGRGKGRDEGRGRPLMQIPGSAPAECCVGLLTDHKMYITAMYRIDYVDSARRGVPLLGGVKQWWAKKLFCC